MRENWVCFREIEWVGEALATEVASPGAQASGRVGVAAELGLFCGISMRAVTSSALLSPAEIWVCFEGIASPRAAA